MKRLLIILMLCVSINTVAATQSRGNSLYDMPPFERACLVIKYYETLHTPKDWPYVGYGHRVQPGEPYKRGVQLTEVQADALLRKDLKKMLELFKDYGSDALLLATLGYNVGPYRLLGSSKIPKSRLLTKLEQGNRDIYSDYLSYNKYKGKRHSGLHRRRMVEYKLLFEKQCD